MDSSTSLHPPPSTPNSRTHSRRFITLYDAVASLATSKGFYNHPSSLPIPNKYRPPPIGADEILGRKSVTRNSHSPSDPQEALIPYPDTNILATLPSSDLLKAIHQYATERYHSLGLPGEKGMDETALVAVGMLMEEVVREVVVLKGAGKGAGAGAFMEEEEEGDRDQGWGEEEADVEDMADREIKAGGVIVTQSEIMRSRSKKRKRAKDNRGEKGAGPEEGLEKSKSKSHSGEKKKKERKKKKRNKRKRDGEDDDNQNTNHNDGDLEKKTRKKGT